jgi:hypothetical protein
MMNTNTCMKPLYAIIALICFWIHNQKTFDTFCFEIVMKEPFQRYLVLRWHSKNYHRLISICLSPLDHSANQVFSSTNFDNVIFLRESNRMNFRITITVHNTGMKASLSFRYLISILLFDCRQHRSSPFYIISIFFKMGKFIQLLEDNSKK